MSIKFDLTAADPIFEVNVGRQLNHTHREFTLEFSPAGEDAPQVTLDRKLDEIENYVPLATDVTGSSTATFTNSVGGIGLEHLARTGFIRFTLNGAFDPATFVRVIFSAN